MESSSTRGHLAEVSHFLSIQSAGSVDTFVQEICNTFSLGGSVFVCGNGGSSALALHLVTDLVKVAIDNGKNFPTFALGSNSALTTMISNDYGYKEVFTLELKATGKEGDLLIAISSSGNSENILNVVRFANEVGIKTIGLVGFDGGRLAELCSSYVHVRTPLGKYAVVEDVHSTICHDIALQVRYATEALQ